ncbi:MAG: GNAT family N-acetyltransferase [Actinomycetota bacterium]|nr:GNAT family N-acetyltransferase [Actinomycetota bacterium]
MAADARAAGIDESARRATTDDVARLGELVALAHDELRPMRGGEIWSRHEARERDGTAWLTTAVTSGDEHVVVGTIDGYPCGYGVARLVPLRGEVAMAEVTDLFVEAPFRDVGVGEAMMDLLVEWANENRCIGIDSIALPGNRATKNFFETFGLTARAIRVHRALGDGGAT